MLKQIFIVLLSLTVFFEWSCKEVPDKKYMTASANGKTDSLEKLDETLGSLPDLSQFICKKLQPLTTDSLARIKTDVEHILFSGPALKALYDSTQCRPIWFTGTDLNDAGKEWLRLLQTTERYGLSSKYYGAGNIAYAVAQLRKNPQLPELAADIEISLSNAWLLLALHLNKGAVGKNQLLNSSFGTEADFYANAVLEAIQQGKVQTRLESLQPSHIHYRNLQQALTGFYKSKNVLPEGFSIREHKRDSAGAAMDAMAALFYQGYTDSLWVDGATYSAALKKFQSEHGLVADGVPGPNTTRMLLTDNRERYRRVALNIERWRSEHFNFQKEYLFINIPAFEAYVVENDQYRKVHRVIVGKPSTKTPELRSDINLVVVNPDWTVPQSIIRNEMRGKSSSYLSKYNIYQNGQQVSPGQINWSAGGIKMVQPPGQSNALGLIKFMFNNSHSVYLHDTPNRNLFETTVRAYSHGCVRLQNPLEMGVFLLQRDGKNISLDSLKAMTEGGKLTNIRLNKSFPIYISYFTAFVDTAGILQLYPDLYKKEEQNAAVLFYGRYDKAVDPAKGKEAIPGIDALPEIFMPEDSLALQGVILP